jgi:hypothetical protein
MILKIRLNSGCVEWLNLDHVLSVVERHTEIEVYTAAQPNTPSRYVSDKEIQCDEAEQLRTLLNAHSVGIPTEDERQVAIARECRAALEDVRVETTESYRERMLAPVRLHPAGVPEDGEEAPFLSPGEAVCNL